MPNPGDVYFYSNFKFSDGEYGSKLIIILNKTENETLCLALKTTSKEHRYKGAIKGCNPHLRVFFIPQDWQRFDLDTYVQLPQIFPLPISKFLQDGMNKFIELKFSLSDDCLKQILNCLKQHYKNDIAPVHWELIFK
jgi:hypothetical protein